MNKKDFTFSVRDIAEIAILSALAIVLDTFVKIPFSLTGGSINFAMVPLFLIALHLGWFKGFISGAFIFGIITCLIDGYGIETYPLDYFVAFGSVAVVGALRKFIIKDKINVSSYAFYFCGILIAFAIRLFGATVDGVILYETGFIDSLIYNATYILPSFVVCCVILLPTLSVFNNLFKRLS